MLLFKELNMLKDKIEPFYNKNYKLLMLIPITALILSLSYLVYFYNQNGDILNKDISLKGGISATIYTDKDINLDELSSKLNGASVRKLADLTSGKKLGIIIETDQTDSEKLKQELESYLGIQLNEENYSVEQTSSSLGSSFYKELILVIILSFILIAFVIFMTFGESNLFKAISYILTVTTVKLTFPVSMISNFLILSGFLVMLYTFFESYKTKKNINYLYSICAGIILFLILMFPYYYFIIPIGILLFGLYFVKSPPSLAVMFAAFTDIVITLAIVDFIGMKVSAAGIIGFLLIIGYSIDTDMLLTSRALKRTEGSLFERMYSSMKTGMTMIGTAITALLIGYILTTSPVLKEIFIIVIIASVVDIFSTYFTNSGIIKIYCDRKGIK